MPGTRHSNVSGLSRVPPSPVPTRFPYHKKYKYTPPKNLCAEVFTFLISPLFINMRLSHRTMALKHNLIRGEQVLMRVTLAVAVACLSLVSITSANDAQASIRQPTNIAAQGLAPALKMLAKDRNVQLVYRSDIVKDQRTGGAAGDLTFEEALTQLLNGTGLTYKFLENNAITIVPIAEPPRARAEGERAGVNEKGEDPSSPSDGRGAGGEVPKSFGSRSRLAQSSSAGPQGLSSSSQQNSESSQQGNSGPVKLEEVTVTAQKRTERSIDVPMSIAAVSGQSLTESQATTLQDLQNRIPGLRVNGGAASTEVVLRNVSIGAGINTSVGTYLDETPYGASGAFSGASFFGLSLDPFDMARIEVLRGPQGTNYGAIAMSGILKYVTNAPDPSAFATRALVGASRLDDATGHEEHAMVNIPLGSAAALRVVAHDATFPGYVDAPDRGARDVNDITRRGFRAAFLWNAMDDLTIRLNAELQKLEVADTDAFTIGATAPGYGQFIRTPAPFAQKADSTAQIYSGTVNWNLGSMSLVSATSFTKAGRRSLIEYAPIAGLVSTVAGGRYSAAINVNVRPDVFSQEVRLASSTDGPFRWAIGGYYSDQSTPNVQYVDPFNLGTRVFESQRASVLGLFDVSSKYREYAGFANMNYLLTDRLTLGAGARYSDNKQSYHQTTTGLVFGVSDFITHSAEDVFTYSVDTKYALNQRNNLYSRIATGFVPGGPNNTVPGSNLPTQYGSSTTTNYEVGMKGVLGGAFTYDVSAFQINWRDIQLQAIFGNFAAVTNGGSARNRGLEVAMGISPARGLTIDLAATYTDARLTEDTPASNGGKAGQRLPNAPNFSSNVSLRYDWPLGHDLDAFTGFDWAYTGNRLTPFSATQPRQVIPSYTTVDARVGVSRGKYRVTLYAKNIFDQLTLSSIASATYEGVTQLRGQITSPRTVGVTLSAQY